MLVFRGQGKPGVDHCFVIDRSSADEPAAAELYEPVRSRLNPSAMHVLYAMCICMYLLCVGSLRVGCCSSSPLSRGCNSIRETSWASPPHRPPRRCRYATPCTRRCAWRPRTFLMRSTRKAFHLQCFGWEIHTSKKSDLFSLHEPCSVV